MRRCTLIPDPHPLDYDWRFDDPTVSRLVERLNFGRVLLIGCPSVATAFTELGRPCWLVDWQPYYGRSELVRASRVDLRYESLDKLQLGLFDAILIDSPWYVDYLAVWLGEALRHTVPGGQLLFTLWPSDVRPEASDEAGLILVQASTAGRPILERGVLGYQTPRFELASASATGRRLDSNWRRGDLVTISVAELPNNLLVMPTRAGPPPDIWQRFVFDQTQVALRMNSSHSGVEPRLIELVHDSVLPDVSRRLNLRADIDLWTSDNIVFRTEGSSYFLSALERILTDTTSSADPLTSSALNLLRKHNIVASHVFRRKLRWQHSA